MSAIRFHAMLPVRDEADIISQCLEHMLNWADAIYVFDSGSADETWDVVQDLASKQTRIKALRKDTVYFSDTLVRGWIFNQIREHMQDGDWFLRCDADEFHHVSPREFVNTRLRKQETIVYHQYYDFKLLASEVANWESGNQTLADRKQLIQDRRRWYVPSIYSEPRLCRYRTTMKWPPSVSFPFNAGYVARERLPIRHYPHRDPEQLKRRCRLRAAMMADPVNRAHWEIDFHHWEELDWRKFVTPDSQSDLMHWARGNDLPEVRFTNHLARNDVRSLQRIAHRFFLPILDRSRPDWPKDAYPQRIPDSTTAALQQVLQGTNDTDARPLLQVRQNRRQSDPRFHAMLCVRGESDIIAQCLEHLLGWADMIYVFDTGSVDGTWEIVEGAALREPRIRPIRRDSVYFSQKLVRGWLFRQARQQMRDGDWFLRVDSDEFYHIPPPEFVKTYMRKHETIAYHQYYNFCLLESEVAAWEGGRETLADRARPIHDRRRWYIPASYSEPRMCRYRRTMRWPSTVSFPYNAGFIARERLPIRHYPHRDPAQLVRRCHLRAAMMADGTRPEWHHWNNTDWRTFVTSDSSPGLKYWNPGQDLPRVDFSSHLSKGHIRLMQRLTHAFLLPALDRLRPDWNDDVYPERIPEVEFRRLEETMLQIDRQLRDGHMEDATFTSSLENVTRK